MSIQRTFSKVLKELGLPTPAKPSKKQGELNQKQEKVVEVTKNLLINNLVGELETWGGFFDPDLFKAAKDKLPESIKKLGVEDQEKDVKSYFENYNKVMKKFLETYVFAKANVKTMPFKTAYMHKLPKIYENDKQNLDINDKPVGYVVELPYQIERSTAYGEMKDAKPLFAPIIGTLDLNWKPPATKPAPGDKEYIEDISLQIALFEAMEKQTTMNSVWRYQNYGRKGEPVCDKLMANDDLMVSMERIISEVDSKSFKANASVCALAYAIDGRTIVAMVDYDGVQKNAFEALFKLSAYLEDVPRTATGGAMGAGGGGAGMVSATAPQNSSLPTWSEQELAQQATTRGSAAPNLPTWSEDELENRPDKFTGGGPNLPVWTEEELDELRKTNTGSSLNLPEWTGDGLLNCPNCGYACQSSWETCPMCDTKLDKSVAPASSPASNAPSPSSQKPPSTSSQKPAVSKKPSEDGPPDAKKIG